MPKTLVSLSFVVLTLSAVSNAAGQDTWHAILAGGPIYSTQASDTTSWDPDIGGPGVGGSAPGFVVSGEAARGVFGFGVELSDIERFTAVQGCGGSSVAALCEQRYRDLIVSALAHLRGRIGSHVAPELVAGVSVVQQSSIERSATAPSFSAPFGPYGPEYSIASSTLGATIGFDIGVRITRHLSIGPTVRAHLIDRSKPNSGGSLSDPITYLNLATVVARVGGTLRVTF